MDFVFGSETIENYDCTDLHCLNDGTTEHNRIGVISAEEIENDTDKSNCSPRSYNARFEHDRDTGEVIFTSDS